ncbi:hypothetical protein JL720_13264 [Aureococcus anophagefferens]|nr:hypothetical protein JL720_13264 [Aureococcus anophagefferens]
MRVPERDAGLVATRGGDGDTAKRAIVAMKAALQRNAKAKTAKLARDKAQGKETPADDAPKKRAAAAPAPAPDEVEIEAEASPAAPQSGDAEHRMKIFEEILSSETNYVRDLGVICHIFLAPIEKHELLSRGDIDKVFGNVRELRQIHTELLSKLRKAERERRDMVFEGKGLQAIAAAVAKAHATVFAEMVPFLRAYASYCGTYTAAVACVAALSETKPKLAKFLGKARQVPQCRGLDLASFLIKPPQRLCKYPSSSTTCSSTWAAATLSESRRRISDTLKSVQDVTNRVNSMMAIEGSQNKVFEIWEQNLDKHDSVADLRHHFYLFNDLLLLATPKKSLVTGDRRVNKYKVLDAPQSISLNSNEYLFCLRFEDARAGSMSVHWLEQTPPRADLLIWAADAATGDKLRNELSTRTYEIKLLHRDMQRRAEAGRGSVTLDRIMAGTPSKAPAGAAATPQKSPTPARLKRSDSDDEADAADARDLEEVRDLARSTPNGGGWLASSTQQSPVVADPPRSAAALGRAGRAAAAAAGPAVAEAEAAAAAAEAAQGGGAQGGGPAPAPADARDARDDARAAKPSAGDSAPPLSATGVAAKAE